eukprot:scaffold30999_cov113-Skeletonema_marinoi.AAC.1
MLMSLQHCNTALQTIVPPTDFRVDSVRSFNAMRVMTTALRNYRSLLSDVGMSVVGTSVVGC